MADNFVIDNSIVMSWCFADETQPYAEDVLDSLQDAVAVVPSIWTLEVVNVLLTAERRKMLTPADSARFLTLLGQLPIMVEHDIVERRMGEILALGRANNLSSYDASYLALAMRLGVPIATLDQNLTAAAKEEGVPLYGKRPKL